MVQYKSVVRQPKQSARLRRMAAAFQGPGSGSADVESALLTGATLQVVNDKGRQVWQASNDGTNIAYNFSKTITANTKLIESQPDQMNAWMGYVPAASAITVQLPDKIKTPLKGSWIGFISINALADNYPLSIDPDNGNTGYSINGSNDTVVAIDTDFGSAILVYDGRYSDQWILFRTSGLNALPDTGTAKVVTNTNHQIVQPETVVMVSTGSSTRNITLPSADQYPGTTLFIMKTDSGSGSVAVDPPSTQEINGSTDNRYLYDQYGSISLESDGSDWFISGATGFLGGDGTVETWTAAGTVAPPVQTVLANTNGLASLTVNLPTAAHPQYQNKIITVKKINDDSPYVTLNPSGSETINGLNTVVIRGEFDDAQIISDGSDWFLVGSPIIDGKYKIVNSANYTIVWPNKYILVSPGADARTITLPDPSLYVSRTVTVKQYAAGAGVITIDAAGADTIDGVANTTITAIYESYTFLAITGSQWFITEHYTP